MKISEKDFSRASLKDDEWGYSQTDLDITAQGNDNGRKYRLSLRRNWLARTYEVYRHYYRSHHDVVEFSGTLWECVEWINEHEGNIFEVVK